MKTMKMVNMATGRDELAAPDRSEMGVLVVFDDERTRARALHTQSHLIQTFGSTFRLHFSWWAFKSFWHPKMLLLATRAACRAHVIILSVVQGRDLPQMVKSWLERWASGREGCQPAALGLLETAHPYVRQISLIHPFLRELACKAGVDFISDADSAVTEEGPGFDALPSVHRTRLHIRKLVSS